MDFLLKATRESKGKKRLKHIIILTCRALAIAALVLAVARPLSSSGFFSWGSSKVDTVILILDRSASMELDSADPSLTKREKIIQLTQESIQNLGNAKLVLIDSATGLAMPVATPSSLHEIAQTQATDTTASIPVLLTTAVEYILESNTGRTEIWLASDMQKNNWHPNSGQWNNIKAGLGNISEQTSLRVISLKNGSTNNLATVVKKAQRVGDELLLEIEITKNNDTSSPQVPLTLSLNGVQSTEYVNLSGHSTILNKRLPLSEKSGYGYIQLPSDTNQRDNTSYFSYGTELPVHSAIVAPKGEAQDYFSLASAPPGYAKQQSTVYTPSQPIPFDSLSLVIWQSPLPEGEVKNQMLQFIENGGIVAFFPPINSGLNSENEFLDSHWGVLSKSAEGKYFIIDDWTRNDGPLRNGEDGRSIPVTKLKAIKRRDITTSHTSLSDWSEDTPFLTRAIHGRGAAYFIATVPDYSWSNLGDADVILPLIQRLIIKGNQRFGSGFNTTIGNLPPSIKIDQARSRRLDSASPSNPLNSKYEAGIYRFGERTIAINRSNDEDSILELENDQLDVILADTDYRLFEEDSKKSSSIGQQLWQPLLIAMLAFMIIEAFLCLVKKRTEIAPATKA